MQENTAKRAESAEEADTKKNEAAVTRLSAMLQRVCKDEATFDVRVSALIDTLGAVIVELAHNDEGVLVLEDVIGIRDNALPYLTHAVTRHTLARIGKDHTTVGTHQGDDELKDLANALDVVKRRGRASTLSIPPQVAMALASLFGRRES